MGTASHCGLNGVVKEPKDPTCDNLLVDIVLVAPANEHLATPSAIQFK